MKIVINIPKEKYQVIKTAMYARVGEETAKQLIKYIKNGKPLKEEPKTGHWIEQEVFERDAGNIEEWQSARCDKCKKYLTTPYMYYFNDYDYCPNCGAKMVEPQKSEASDG